MILCPPPQCTEFSLDRKKVDFSGTDEGKIRNQEILTQSKVACSLEEQRQCVKFSIFLLLSTSHLSSFRP